MELEGQWQEHELGSYPVIVLSWEEAMRAAPRKYLSNFQYALFEFEVSAETLPLAAAISGDSTSPLSPGFR
jgi:hypothetical protein